MFDWKTLSLNNECKTILLTHQSDKIIESCSVIAEQRFNEYYARNPYTTINKIKRDFAVGLFCEQGFYNLVSPFLTNIGCSITEPDLEFHTNNIHGYDFIINGNIHVSVKGIDTVYNGVRSWVYQPDKLSVDESLHLFMQVHRTKDNYEKGDIVLVEWLYMLSGKKIPALLKPTFKPMNGKMAIYESDIKEEL
jgi:hypothetical protein